MIVKYIPSEGSNFFRVKYLQSFLISKVTEKLKREYGLLKVLVPLFSMASCGKSEQEASSFKDQIGFPVNYVPPPSDFNEPLQMDPFYKTLEKPYLEPYWVSSLEMYQGSDEIKEVVGTSGRTIKYSFPNLQPNYIGNEITGFKPASEEMKEASRQILNKLSELVEFDFIESPEYQDFNTIVIGQSQQTETAGFGYFPNSFFELGFDVFISEDFSNPIVYNTSLTNYDYEILIHEIGHALGLKHPFEPDRSNGSMLSDYEDNTKFTVMSYDQDLSTFDGNFRMLDMMVLTKFYGVNSNYNALNNSYYFSEKSGIFIIDGGGVDTIDAFKETQNIYIDLRPGMHSFVEEKSAYITDAKQLTISHYSDIENIISGGGNDTIVANNLENVIKTSDGDDKIYAGEGADFIDTGPGSDIVDLSEVAPARDTVFFSQKDVLNGFDIIHGFKQGVNGDLLVFEGFEVTELTFLPLVIHPEIPTGSISNCVVRIVDHNIINEEKLLDLLAENGYLNNWVVREQEMSVIIAASDQETGTDQNIYSIYRDSYDLTVNKVVSLQGNYLDIDMWSFENFSENGGIIA